MYDTNDVSWKPTEGFRGAIILHDNDGDNEIVGHCIDQRVGHSGTKEETGYSGASSFVSAFVHDIYFWLFILGITFGFSIYG